MKFTTFSLRTSDFAEEGHYAIYNDGQLVYETDFVATFGRGNDTFNVSGHGPFDQIVFSALIQTDLSDGWDYGISDIIFTPSIPDAPTDEFGANSISDGDGEADSPTGGAGADDFVDLTDLYNRD